MNFSLWSACGTANASLFNSAQYNDPVPAILSYLRSQSQAEVAAMSASAELYGTFQVNWRSEVINSEQGTSGTNALHLAAFESDLAWAQKVASARDAYYAELGESTSSFNESFLDALESYNSSMLGAEFARAQGLFNASKDYSLGSYSIESEYARTRFETSAAYSLSILDAAVAEMVGLADIEAYYARKSADEYAGIGIDENGILRRWDIDTKNSTAAYEKRSLITETKKAADALLNALNQSNTTADNAEYQGSLLMLQAVYDAAIALAEETYNSTITTAENDAYAAIDTADQAYNNSFDSLSNLFGTALEIIDNGGNVETGYFSNAANNFGASYTTQVNNTNQQTQKKPGLLDRLKSFGSSAKQYAGYFIAELGPAYVRNADNVQTTLDVGSPLPIIGIPADALNGTIHAVRGNYAGVATSGLGMVPFFGDAYQAGRLAKKGADLLGEAAKNHAIQEALEKGDIHVTKITRPPRHHLFPQEHRQWFKDRGIDIDKYTIELEQGVHEAIHRQDWEGHWNKELMKRLTKAEKDAGRQLTVREIWNIMDGLRRQYKLPNDIVPYR